MDKITVELTIPLAVQSVRGLEGVKDCAARLALDSLYDTITNALKAAGVALAR